MNTVSKNKIALIRAPIVSTMNSLNNEATPCIALAYLASQAMSLGYEVEIVDAIGQGLNEYWVPKKFPENKCQGLTFEQILEQIPKDAGVIGFSAMFSGEWPIVRELIKYVRKSFPESLFIAGGEHISALTEFSLRECPEINICVRGEGEGPFCEVIEANKNNIDFKTINSIAYIDNDGNYTEGEGLPRIRDIDSISWPYWPEGYMEEFWKHGKSYGVATEFDMPIMASRGCPFQCTFCSSPNMWTTKYILRSIDDLIAEIKKYKEKYNITALQFYDLTAIVKKSWTVEFCNRLISENINLKWSLPSGTRSEALDEETLTLLNKTGCNYLVYAPESGSPETLKKIKKRIKLDKFTDSVLTAKKVGLILRTNLIIGFPHENRKNIYETIRYGLYLAIKGVDEVSINIFSPYPGTELFNALLDAGEIELNDEYFLSLTSLNSDYSSFNPMTVNPYIGKHELAIYRLFFMLSNYAIGYLLYPSRIIRTLKNITEKKHTATVFEHRLRDMFARKKSSAN